MSASRDAGVLVEIVTEARTVSAYEHGIVEHLQRRIGFEIAIFKRPDAPSTHGVDAKVARACARHWSQFKVDSAPVLEVALRQRGVAVDLDVLGFKRLERLAVYQRLMRPHGGTSTAFVCLTRHGSPVSLLALGRTRGAFAPRELDYLRSIAPTLSVCETAAVAAPIAPAPFGEPHVSLTPREREVLAHLRLGHTNAQIGLALGSAERTVRNQLSKIYEKLGVASRAEAAAVSGELGLVRLRS